MSEYRIEKVRRQVSILLMDGSRLEGDVFLRPLSRHRPEPEEPTDLLNDDEPFFAFERHGETVLIAKSSVARAETQVREEGELTLASLGVPVEVTMNDGTVCSGSVFLETRADRPRLLDFLNSYRSRFLPVVDAKHVQLINTQSIAHVREVAS
jgi:hypothetical protein